MASWTATVVRALDAHGHDGEALARKAGIDTTVFHHSGGRVPLGASTRLWRLAVEATGDPSFSLQVARFVRPSTFAGLSMGVVSSPSFRSALERLGRYHGMVMVGSGTTTVTERPGSVSWAFRPDTTAHRPCDEAMEAIAASIILAGRFLVDRSLSPTAVHLARPSAPAEGRFEEFYGCPVHYGATEWRLTFAADTVDQQATASSPVLAAAAERVARNDLQQLSSVLGFGAQVRAAVTSLLTAAADAGASTSTVTTAAVAERVAVSPRTLQRRLRGDGTTLRQIVGDVRVELARELLMVDGLSVDAVAARLGFHDAASFRRAFKRGTGTTPAAYIEATAAATSFPVPAASSPTSAAG